MWPDKRLFSSNMYWAVGKLWLLSHLQACTKYGCYWVRVEREGAVCRRWLQHWQVHGKWGVLVTARRASAACFSAQHDVRTATCEDAVKGSIDKKTAQLAYWRKEHLSFEQQWKRTSCLFWTSSSGAILIDRELWLGNCLLNTKPGLTLQQWNGRTHSPQAWDTRTLFGRVHKVQATILIV